MRGVINSAATIAVNDPSEWPNKKTLVTWGYYLIIFVIVTRSYTSSLNTSLYANYSNLVKLFIELFATSLLSYLQIL